MKKTTAITLLFFTAASYFLYVGCGQGTPDASKSGSPKSEALLASMPSRLPQDVMQSCTLSQAEFNSWFASGTASENGLVLPANSVTFGHNNNCDFYQWSWQMFAWLVSPLSANETVMSSPIFYTVSPVDGGNRNLIPHVAGQALRATSSITQAGPNGLPTIMDKDGKLHEVETAAPKTKLMLLKGTQKTAVSKVEMDANGKPVFKDQAGKVIDNPKAITKAKGNVVQAFTATNGQTVLLGPNGVIESEEGQAGGSHGLMAQNGSIVYYISMVNDVFAVYLSAAKTGNMSGFEFPTTAAQRDSIVALAAANNITLPDPNALAIEIKTSWVEASTLPDASNYVTINAIIPLYNKSNPKQWVPLKRDTTVKLALLGTHVVGSTAGHPEMVWATFEHLQNSPFAAYQYLNSKNVVDTVPQETQGKWTLNGNPTDPNPNNFTFSASGNTLTGKVVSDPQDPTKSDTVSVSPCNTTLVFPWGSEMGQSPNAEDGSSAASNSEVISINQSVFGWLVGNDIRKNYLLIGATWTNGGVAPSGKNFSTSPTDPGAAIGTSLLANSTMETFKQSNQNSCFGCHSTAGSSTPSNPPSLSPNILSHIYPDLQPLPGFKGLPVK